MKSLGHRYWVGCGGLVLAALALLTACTTTQPVSPSADPQTKQYRDALEALLEDNYLDANTKFEELATKSLDQHMQGMARLRLGDTLFFQGRYRESAEVFREYLTQNDDSPDAPHAGYMRALAFLRRCPEDSWIMPPAESREMGDVELAYASFLFLVQRYPDSYYALRGRYQIASVAQRRCRNHQYVAEYYEGRDTPAGTIQRLEQGFAMEEKERQAGYLAPSMNCIVSARTLRMLADAYVQLGDAAGFWRVYQRARQFPLLQADERASLLADLVEAARSKGWDEPTVK